MHTVLIVAIVFGGLVLGLAVIGGTILMAIRLRHGAISPGDRKYQADEAKMVQDIYHGLSRMEKRVDALETILMDGLGKDDK